MSSPQAQAAPAEWESIDCPVCGGQTSTPLFELKGEPFVRCSGCGLMFINPRPVHAKVVRTYDASYSAGYAAKLQRKLRRVRRWVRRVRRRYGGERWLDVGCSIGTVCYAARELGYEAWGIDVEPWGIEFARTELSLTRMDCGLLEERGYPEASFDVISLYDVIEHVPDLNRFCAELRRILRPHGVIDLRTPDLGHWRVPSPLQTWDAVKPSEHLYYFNAETLARLLRHHGLRIERRRLSLKPGLNVYVRHADGGADPWR